MVRIWLWDCTDECEIECVGGARVWEEGSRV